MWHCHTQYVRQSEVFTEEKQTWSLKEEEFIARNIGAAIFTCGWSTVSKGPDQEFLVRRLLALELLASGRPWSDASILEESRVGYRPSGISVIKYAL